MTAEPCPCCGKPAQVVGHDPMFGPLIHCPDCCSTDDDGSRHRDK